MPLLKVNRRRDRWNRPDPCRTGRPASAGRRPAQRQARAPRHQWPVVVAAPGPWHGVRGIARIRRRRRCAPYRLAGHRTHRPAAQQDLPGRTRTPDLDRRRYRAIALFRHAGAVQIGASRARRGHRRLGRGPRWRSRGRPARQRGRTAGVTGGGAARRPPPTPLAPARSPRRSRPARSAVRTMVRPPSRSWAKRN